jgi:superfamily II DNA or RNA helicase
MNENLFQSLVPNISGNKELRVPQREAYDAVAAYDFTGDEGREVGIVLPVGCGKSGLLAIAPFAAGSHRALLVAPNVAIAQQLFADLTPTNSRYFYDKRKVLAGSPYPEAAELRSGKANLADLQEADVVVTNIQQLQSQGNKWLAQMDDKFFDLILFDEGHHNVAESWQLLREKFPDARIINVSATPSRADGRLMSGQIIYSYPVIDAVKNGYVKRISGHRLNPKTLKYVRQEDGEEVVVTLDEVRKLGEEDSKFRRSIVSSEETLTTIVEASIRKLTELRDDTGEKRLKIIASALNMAHCQQIVAKYTELGLRAGYVHTLEAGAANAKVHQQLENHELDVIVQVRKLGEGFDHPFLAVAAVFSIFSNLSPFMQFVGRIMRVIPGVEASSAVNDGVVVFHVGGNVTGVWNDFAAFAEGDQEWLGKLVDENIGEDVLEEDVDPLARRGYDLSIPIITEQGDVHLENVPLLSSDDPRVLAALQVLKDAGMEDEAVEQITEQLRKIQPSKQATRQAKKKLLDDTIKTKAGQLLVKHDLKPGGRKLDVKRLGKDNFVVVKSAIDRVVNASVGRKESEREFFTAQDYADVFGKLNDLVAAAEKQVFDA